MQLVKGDVPTILELVAQTKHAMYVDACACRQLVQASIAHQQGPTAGFGDGKCSRLACILTSDGRLLA